MLPLYLFALIVGGGLLLFSLMAGHGDSDGPGVESGADADADIAPDFDHEGAGGHDWVSAQDFLSVRTLLYLLAGFGATGTLIELLTGATTPVSFAWALLTGLAAAMLAASVYGWVRRTDSGVVPTDPDYLIGATARVILPVVHGHRGKILALHQGREVELLARLYGSEDPDCPRGSEVVIIEVDGETALVAALPQLSSESALE